MKKINLCNRFLIVAGIIFGATWTLQAQRPDDELKFLKFEWSNVIGNLTINPNSYLQDSRGLMWIASSSGVVSFDGYNFKLYSPDEYNLSATRSTRLAEDINGNIWIISLRNSRIVVDIMNPKTETVIPLHRYLGLKEPVEIPLREDIVVLHNTGGRIWLGNTDTGYLYDGQWKQIFNRNIVKESYDGWWPAAYGVWTIKSGKKAIYLESSAGELLDSVPCRGYVWLDDQLNLWSAPLEDKSVFHQLKSENSRIINTKMTRLPPFSWIGETLCPGGNATAPLRYGYLWNVRRPELYMSRSDGSGTINFSRQFPEISSVSNFYIDRQGGIWTSSKNKIIRLTEKRPTGFQTFLSDASLDRSVRGMIQIGNQLYVNSYKGDCRINLDNLSVSNINLLMGQGLSFLRDQNGFWAGGHGGMLAHINPGKSEEYFNPERRSDINVFLRTSNGILLGTANGLLKIHPDSHSVDPLPLENIAIDYLYRNNRGIWACTTNGLYLIDNQGHTIAHYLPQGASTGYDRLTHLYEDENGSFWISTRGGGLIHWSVEKGIIHHFTTSNGLSNNDIHAVYPDNMGHLWLPGNYGLMRLHKESGRIRVFFKKDGIADSEFNALSHYQAPDGRLFFGGVNGITAFYPADIPVKDAYTPELRLLEARTFRIKNGNFINHLQETDAGGAIVVTPDDDYLDIRVSPLVYEDVNQIRYSWKIEGYSEEWAQQQSPLIRLYNLPYGTYSLRVRYSMQGNLWSENELNIPITVHRPFYLSWPFLTLLLGLVFGTAWGMGNWRSGQLRKANLKLEEEVKNRTRQIENDKQLIEQQARELQSLDEMKSRFFANITHELRTPLTLILGPAARLLQGETSREKTIEYTAIIQRNGAKLLNLVEELLDLSKVEAKKLIVVEKPARLYQFIARLVAAFAPYADHRGVELNLVYNCPATTTLMMDIPKWEKIINNLLNNALKFTPQGGTVVVTVEISNDELVISVEDTGIGIHADDLPFIFDRYYQARSEGATLQGGTGIGLSLCREYIKLFGGDISVQSEPGRGSKFTLRRPLAISTIAKTDGIADLTETVQTPESNQLPKPKTHLPGKRTILLVEDDRDMSSYVQSILRADYNLLTAENGKKALALLDETPVDLILSDIMMPEMDGFQLLQAVRERYLDIPFIMLTARADAPDRLNALTLGVDDYLTKPFMEAELTLRLQNLITRYDARKAARSRENNIGETERFDQKWLKQLELLIMENIGNADLAINELADKMNISRRNMYNKVVACTGMSPSQYLTEVRLNRARYLIETGAFETIAEVCYAVGFKTPHYFSKLMKERFG